MLPLLRRRAWVVASALLVTMVVVASLVPSGSMPVPPVRGFDKVEHFVAYALLAAWFAGIYPRSRYLRIAIWLTALGAAIEILQQAMGLGREGDPFDLMADIAGIGAGLLLAATATGGWALRLESWLARR